MYYNLFGIYAILISTHYYFILTYDHAIKTLINFP